MARTRRGAEIPDLLYYIGNLSEGYAYHAITKETMYDLPPMNQNPSVAGMKKIFFPILGEFKSNFIRYEVRV